MKLKYLITSVTSVIMLCLCSSCEQTELPSQVQPTANEESKDPGFYPMSITNSATRSGNQGGYWEDWDYIKLASGREVQTPWNQRSTISSVPQELLEDIKYDDGWDLIFHQLEDNSGGEYVRNSPYLVFHNRYTGILKVFCFMSSASFNPNNYGIWQITTSDPTSLFAFQNTPISHISEKQKNTYYVGNMTKNATHGFTIGWNCFQIELAYDPSQSGKLEITTLTKNVTKMNLTGNLEATTDGLLISSTSSNQLSNGVAKLAGNSAGDWINKKIGDKTILGLSASTIAGGVKDLVTGGVGYIINAFTGLFRKDNTPKSMQLTTNGTFNITGELEFASTAGIDPLKINLEPDSLGFYLGVWGLNDESTLLFTPYGVLKSPQEYTNGYTREYNLNCVNSHSSKASIAINPRLTQYFKDSSVKYYQTDKITRMNIWGRMGSLGQDPRFTSKVYDNLYEPSFTIIANVAFLGDEDVHMPIDQFEAPMEVFVPNVPGGPNGAIPNFFYHSRYVSSIGVRLSLPNGSEAYSYHQCYPKIDWSYSDFDNGLYQYFYPCVPVDRINTMGRGSIQNLNLQQYVKATSEYKH